MRINELGWYKVVSIRDLEYYAGLVGWYVMWYLLIICFGMVMLLMYIVNYVGISGPGMIAGARNTLRNRRRVQ